MNSQRILFIRGGAVGDFVLTSPLLWALRENWPGAEIEILGHPEIAMLATRRGPANAVGRVDAADLAPVFSRHGELCDSRRAYFRAFDLIVCVWPDGLRTIRERLGATGAPKVVMIDPVPAEDSRGHVIDAVVDQARSGGIEVKSSVPYVSLSERDRWWAETYLRVTGAGFGPLLAMHPGSGSKRKNWQADRFADIAREWIRWGREGGVLLTQGPADEEAVRSVACRLPANRCWVLRNETLPHLAAVLDRCKGFVGNDSGITHLAAAVSTPTVAVFGPTDARIWAPRGRQVVAVQGGEVGAFPESGEVLEALRGLVL